MSENFTEEDKNTVATESAPEAVSVVSSIETETAANSGEVADSSVTNGQTETPSSATETSSEPAEAPNLEPSAVTEVSDDLPSDPAQEDETADATAGEEATGAVEEEKPVPTDKLSIVERIEELVKFDFTDKIRSEIDSLKQAFYRLKNAEDEEARNAFITEGGNSDDFQPLVDELESRLKSLLVIFKEKKAVVTAQTEKILEANLKTKQDILARLKELVDSKEDFFKVNNEFRKLQQQWKEIKKIPQAAANELWKDYQTVSEQFYDLLKINLEMRDYDFRKNLELKQDLCKVAEKLSEEKDAVSAFFNLQKIQQEWREIGPVAKELREEIWQRFKKASSLIYKKYQDHFDSLREIEKRNLAEKTACCEQLESIDYSLLTNFKEWDAKLQELLALQEKWKTIGFAPKKHNTKIFERFRAACDKFFDAKSAFYKERTLHFKDFKKELNDNYKKKKALCEQAEALKDAENKEEAAAKIAELQKEWRTIGQAPRKYSDAVWSRFVEACNYFSPNKTEAKKPVAEEIANLRKKRDIIEKINSIDETLSAKDAMKIIRDLMAEWRDTGFVPFRDKEKILTKYHNALEKQFDRLKIEQSERRLRTFSSSIRQSGGGNALLNEREELMSTFERLKSDIQTYENNIGFLSVASKGGGGLVREMNAKIESLKSELELLVKKIEVIDTKLKEEK